jgi:hypothetical protein
VEIWRACYWSNFIMQEQSQSVKPDVHGDAIGQIDYPVKFEKAALPAGVLFVLVATVTMITGSPSKAISLIVVAVMLVCALYALFRAWPAIAAWLTRHPRLSTATHFALIFGGAFVGFALMVGGK